jgi:hypothetical protein
MALHCALGGDRGFALAEVVACLQESRIPCCWDVVNMHNNNWCCAELPHAVLWCAGLI